MSAITLTYSISKAAMELVKTGQAVLSSGGVRLLNGELLELAKPVLTTAVKTANGFSLGPVGAAATIVSSVTNNVQNVFIQHSLNAANKTLTQAVESLGSISNALKSIEGMAPLAWTSTAFSVASCCISAVSLQMTMERFDALQELVYDFYNRYKNDKLKETINDCKETFLNLKTHIYAMKECCKDGFDAGQFNTRQRGMEKDLSHARSLLEDLIDQLAKDEIDGKIACPLITSMSGIYAKTLNDFCSLYYYAKKTQYEVDDYLSVIDALEKPEFQTALGNHLILDAEYADISIRARYNARRLVLESIDEQKNRLIACSELIRELPAENYSKLDEYVDSRLKQAIDSGNVTELENGRMLISLAS